MNLDRAAFFLPHAQFSAMVPENRANKTAHPFTANDAAFPKDEAGSSWQDGGCATRTTLHPAKGFASGLQNAFGAALLTLQKGRKSKRPEAR